ncbi:MAG: hypothetical protein UV95_C0001G0129 [Candidatus Falkowbacteria bacterium GW2011_GWF2_43_32]|nr:MAG: hypothetical protein UV95_C0001G0129 [Candidatus Falkowbacteria bacterium GW2011_GWF2_43_32]
MTKIDKIQDYEQIRLLSNKNRASEKALILITLHLICLIILWKY